MRADNPSQSLRKAVKAGSLPKVLAALASGADPDAPGSSGRTALQIARSRGHDHLLEALAVARKPAQATAQIAQPPQAPVAPHAPAPQAANAPKPALPPSTKPAPAPSVWEEMALRSEGFAPPPVRLARTRARVILG